jgi:glycosyltransferase involved in cell wall biosynthesis
VPGVGLTITGDHAGLPLPCTNHVSLAGVVDDVRPLIASASVSLAPIRVGGGTRLKILEAMALRAPVVATSKGAEGLDVRDGEHLLIADTPEAFADATIRLLKEPGLRERLADNAYQLVREHYDWAVVMPRFLHLVERVAHG